jgi:hypothetical protein
MFSKIVLVPAALGALAMQAHAALPAGVDTAITAVETDGIALVGLVAAAGAAVYLIAKVLARFGFKL